MSITAKLQTKARQFASNKTLGAQDTTSPDSKSRAQNKNIKILKTKTISIEPNNATLPPPIKKAYEQVAQICNNQKED